jgi:hypothetical protein
MDGWNEYSKMVLHELKRLNNGVEKLEEGQKAIEKDIVRLQTKATFWGAVGGFILALLTNIIFWFVTNK